MFRAALRDSALANANLSGAILVGASATGSGMANANLSGADLTGVRIERSTLTKANLQGATLAGTRLLGVSLREANLAGANLKNADLSQALIDRTVFDAGTIYSQWTLFPVDFDPISAGLTFEQSPRADFSGNGVIDAGDADLLMSEIRFAAKTGLLPLYDLDSSLVVDADDLQVWVSDYARTWIGDANLDDEFNNQDLVALAAAGEYEDKISDNSGWATGDWNGDKDFTSADLIVALANGGYERGPRAAASAVPEPASIAMLMGGLVGIGIVSSARPRRVS